MGKKAAHYNATALCFVICLSLYSAGVAGEHRVIVGFHQAPGAAEQDLIRHHHGKLKRKFKRVKALSATLSPQAIAQLQNSPGVAYVEEDVTIRAIDPVLGSTEYRNSWGVSRIGSQSVHAKNITGAGTKVAILDTGIDHTHPELARNYRGGTRFLDGEEDGQNQDPFDDSWNSHGTHLAGIVAAAANGVEVVGVAPDAMLYAVKILDGGGAGFLSDLIAGIEWSIENDMDIINMSIGLRQDYRALADAVARADDAGILLVASAGNTGVYSLGEVLYPARYSQVLAVGATNQDDSLNYMSAFGPDVELVAPGDGIYSTTVYGGYNILTGTSQASAHVAGVAALTLAAGLNDLNGDGLTDNRDLRQRLLTAAVDLGEPGKDDKYGYGLVNAAAALSKHRVKDKSPGSNDYHGADGDGHSKWKVRHHRSEKREKNAKHSEKQWRNKPG